MTKSRPRLIWDVKKRMKFWRCEPWHETGVRMLWRRITRRWGLPRKKIFDDLAQRIAMMETLMDQFNDVVKSLPARAGFTHVRYIDLPGTLSNRLMNYKDWWANELHPTEKGFEAVTERFAAELAKLP